MIICIFKMQNNKIIVYIKILIAVHIFYSTLRCSSYEFMSNQMLQLTIKRG